MHKYRSVTSLDMKTLKKLLDYQAGFIGNEIMDN
jgi:hypothetical protein